MTISLDIIYRKVLDVEQAVLDLPANLRVITAEQIYTTELSAITADMGTLKAGEIRVGTAVDPGDGFYGLRLAYPPMSYNSTTWNLAGVSNDTLQIGIRASDGKLLAGAGEVILDSTGITVGSSSPQIIISGPSKMIYSSNFISGLSGFRIQGATGDAEFNNLIARGEIRTAVFSISEIQANAGSIFVGDSAAVVHADFVAPAVSSTVSAQFKNSPAGGSLFAANDIIRIKDWDGTAVRDTWFTVTVVGANSGPYTTYTIRTENGSTGWTVKAGASAVGYGPNTGAGFIFLSADGTIGSSANMSIATHAGSPWSTTTLRTRVGNLNGSYGCTGDYYGIGLGDYASGNYLRYNWDGSGSFELKTLDGGFSASGNTFRFTDTDPNVNTLDWYFDDSGTPRHLGNIYGDWTGGGQSGALWITSFRGSSDPWPASKTIVGSYDSVVGVDLRIDINATVNEISLGTSATDYLMPGTITTVPTIGGDATFTGHIKMENNKQVMAKDSGSTYRNLITMSTSDEVVIGESSGPIPIKLRPGQSNHVLKADTTGVTVENGDFFVTQSVKLLNNQQVQQKDPGGTYRNLIVLDSNDEIVIGESSGGQTIKLRPGVSNPVLTITDSPEDVYTTAWTEYSDTSTIVGWSSYTVKEIWYKKIGKLVFVQFDIGGTSDSTSTSFTLPFTQQNDVYLSNPCGTRDSGSWSVGRAEVYKNANTATFYTNQGTGGWTASGTKTIVGQFVYQTN